MTKTEVIERVSRETCQKLEVYVELLTKWNRTINLVSKSTLEDVWERHIADSLQVMDVAPDSGQWIDLGSGGGLPGLIVAAASLESSPDRHVTLVESDGRKLVLLNDTTPHYVASFAHPEWHFSMDDDPVKAAETRRTILAECAASQVPVIGFHLPFPSIGFVETREDGFEFRPATYQFQLRG